MAEAYWILDELGDPEQCDMLAWAKWLESSTNRDVEKTQIASGVSVSTVFLGVDHSFGDGPPLLFETMIFGGDLDQECWRYSTRREAIEGHKAAVELAKGGAE